MARFTEFMDALSGIIWGPIMLVLLVGTGLYLTLGLRLLTWRRIPTAFRLLWQGRATSPEEEELGEIAPFNA